MSEEVQAIRIGSRGSALALWQANFVAASLRDLGHSVSIEIIRTTGDRMQQLPAPFFGGKGLFTREIEDALLESRIDLAVHSLKDLPTAITGGLVLGAIPRRADPRDVLVSERHSSFSELPHGAVIGTGSLRRQAQLRRSRPDLRWIEFRGNVDTRLAKLGQGKADAIILAAAGLDRLDRTLSIRQRFAPRVLCPAAGQGALAVQCRAGDRRILAAIAPLDHPPTRRAVSAERHLLEALGGGCQMPIGAFASHGNAVFDLTGAESKGPELENPAGELFLLGVVSSPDGEQLVSGEASGQDPEEVALRLARHLLDQGAQAILGQLAGGEGEPA